MFSRIKSISTLASLFLTAVASAAPAATGSLRFLTENPIRSQTGTIRSLAADDFRMPTGQRCELRQVEAIMLSTTGTFTSNSFVLRVFGDVQINGLGRPAELLFAKLGAARVTNLGPVVSRSGQRFIAFRVKFVVPTGIYGLELTPSSRYWVSVSSALSPRFGHWSMARRDGPEAGVGLSPARANIFFPTGEWTMPAPIQDLAFITVIEVF